MTGVVGVPPASASIGTAAAMLASVCRRVRVWVAMIVSSFQGRRGEDGGGELPGTPPPSASLCAGCAQRECHGELGGARAIVVASAATISTCVRVREAVSLYRRL